MKKVPKNVILKPCGWPAPTGWAPKAQEASPFRIAERNEQAIPSGLPGVRRGGSRTCPEMFGRANLPVSREQGPGSAGVSPCRVAPAGMKRVPQAAAAASVCAEKTGDALANGRANLPVSREQGPGSAGASPCHSIPAPCPPCLRVEDEPSQDEAVEDALYQSAMAGAIRAPVFWLVNRAPYKWRPVWRLRMNFMPRMPSLASLLRVSEPRLRTWARSARSRRWARARVAVPAFAFRPLQEPSPRSRMATGGTPERAGARREEAARAGRNRRRPFDYDAWTRAVRAGRTFTTNGPLIDLAVEGKEIGESIRLPRSGGTLEVHAEAECYAPLGRLEIVANGRPVAEHMLALVEGGTEYLDTLATHFDERSRKRMVRLFSEARRELEGRLLIEARRPAHHGGEPYHTHGHGTAAGHRH